MAGEKNNGHKIKSSDTKLHKAWCEGMTARTQGLDQTANPHEVGLQYSDGALSWDAGWTRADGQVGNALTHADVEGCACVGLDVPVIP